MKAVLMSIQPKWVEKIANGEKTIEVRKNRPKIETPFKCYIYCTKHKERLIEVIKKGDDMGWGCTYKEDTPMFIKTFADTALLGTNMVGKVIGEFVCDRVYRFVMYATDGGNAERRTQYELIGENCKIIDKFWCECCIEPEELAQYIHSGEMVFGWHISKLKIYDKPKELSEFKRWNRTEENAPCAHTKWLYQDCKDCNACNLTRPPQSYMFVEEK